MNDCEHDHDHTEANLAAVAFVREALKAAYEREHELPDSTLQGYLMRVYQAAGSPPDGIDAHAAVMEVIKSLAQMTAAAMALLATEPGKEKADVEEVLENLAGFQAALLFGDDGEGS